MVFPRVGLALPRCARRPQSPRRRRRSPRARRVAPASDPPETVTAIARGARLNPGVADQPSGGRPDVDGRGVAAPLRGLVGRRSSRARRSSAPNGRAPDDLVHLDIMPLGRFRQIGHRIHGNPSRPRPARAGVRPRGDRRLSSKASRVVEILISRLAVTLRGSIGRYFTDQKTRSRCCVLTSRY